MMDLSEVVLLFDSPLRFALAPSFCPAELRFVLRELTQYRNQPSPVNRDRRSTPVIEWIATKSCEPKHARTREITAPLVTCSAAHSRGERRSGGCPRGTRRRATAWSLGSCRRTGPCLRT